MSCTKHASIIKQCVTVHPPQVESWWLRVIVPVLALELNRQLSKDAQMALSTSLGYTQQHHGDPGCHSGESGCSSQDKRKMLVKQWEERSPCILLCSHWGKESVTTQYNHPTAGDIRKENWCQRHLQFPVYWSTAHNDYGMEAFTMSLDEWIKEMSSKQTGGYCSGIKENEVWPLVSTWMSCDYVDWNEPNTERQVL